MKSALATIILVTLAHPTFAAPAPIDEARTALASWSRAFNAHDPKALAALYTDDVTFIYAFEGQEGAGKAALQKFFAGSFKALPDVAVALQSLDVVPLSADAFVAMAIWDDTFTKDGKKVTVPVQSSEVFVHTKAGWRIQVDHASFAPPPARP